MTIDTKRKDRLEEAALCQLLDTVEEYVTQGDYNSLNNYLRDFEYDREDTMIQTGLLRFTARYARYLPAWSESVEKSYKHHVEVLKLPESQVQRRFQGLK